MRLVLVTIAAILMIGHVSAGDWVDTTGLTVVSTTTYTPTPTSNITEGGERTALNIYQDMQTDKWAAYYGNLTGKISLRNAAGTYSVFDWDWNISETAEVCAVAGGTDFNWAALVESTFAELDGIWGFDAGDTDSATNTFSLTESFDIAGSGSIVAPSFQTGPDSGGTFETGALEDTDDAGKEDYAFCVNTNSTGIAYDGSAAHYELMVPTNETADTTETYYFYVELN